MFLVTSLGSFGDNTRDDLTDRHGFIRVCADDIAVFLPSPHQLTAVDEVLHMPIRIAGIDLAPD